MPPLPKPAERRQRRNVTGLAEATSAVALMATLPDNRGAWLKHTKQEWHLLWTEQVPAHYRPTDLDGVRRLFDYKDERERIMRHMPPGPLFEEGDRPSVFRLDKVILELEREYGLTPKSRVALGLQLAEAQKTLEDLNREADEVDDEPDPRLGTDERAESGPMDRT